VATDHFVGGHVLDALVVAVEGLVELEGARVGDDRDVVGGDADVAIFTPSMPPS
jgi:hypothetical protein